ncbi:MAG: DUF4097 family beta strand repeat protein [Gemmatimonadota bacterium]|nr:MAG: DUF4097 family beta strand repeat protein [Gemmatimonadota bacterium]
MFSRSYLLPLVLVALACASTGTGAPAPQEARVVQDDDWCRESGYDRDRDHYCEVREFTLRADREVIVVDAAPNGGIKVEGWDRNEILVRAKVQAQARHEGDARGIVSEIDVLTGGTISADGPRTGRNEGWSVSFRVYVPHDSNLELESTNGGITITDVSGDMRFRTTNGGIHLSGLQGDVDGRTTNGGLHIELEGDEWEGAGLDVQTTNGGIKLYVPDDYRCHLESGTVNGSFRIDFPITVQGRIDRRITADIGGGGTTIRVFTTNGSVSIRRG